VLHARRSTRLHAAACALLPPSAGKSMGGPRHTRGPARFQGLVDASKGALLVAAFGRVPGTWLQATPRWKRVRTPRPPARPADSAVVHRSLLIHAVPRSRDTIIRKSSSNGPPAVVGRLLLVSRQQKQPVIALPGAAHSNCTCYGPGIWRMRPVWWVMSQVFLHARVLKTAWLVNAPPS
jgi:hypothetical protein